MYFIITPLRLTCFYTINDGLIYCMIHHNFYCFYLFDRFRFVANSCETNTNWNTTWWCTQTRSTFGVVHAPLNLKAVKTCGSMWQSFINIFWEMTTKTTKFQKSLAPWNPKMMKVELCRKRTRSQIMIMTEKKSKLCLPGKYKIGCCIVTAVFNKIVIFN